MYSTLVGITAWSLYNSILILAGFVLSVLGLTFLRDGVNDYKTKQRVMSVLDTLLGFGLVIIGVAVAMYTYIFL